jgi:hypothetical protein
MQEEEDAALARRLMEQEQQAEQQQAAQRHRVRNASKDLQHATDTCLFPKLCMLPANLTCAFEGGPVS